MSYNSSTHKITAPVNQNDVQQALGISSPDWDVLCASPNINMWAKWKPIKAPYKGQLTSAIMEGLPNTYRYGINRSGAGSVALWNPSTGELNHDVWAFDIPSGGDNGPYRIADYGCWDTPANPGYYHLAPCPVQLIFPDPLELNINDTQGTNTTAFVFNFQNGINGWNVDGTCLSITDIFTTGERQYYLTVGLLRWTGSTMKQYYVSSSQKLGQMSTTNPVAIVELDQNDFRAKIGSTYLTNGQQWKAIMFLSSNRYTGETDLGSNTIVMLEYEQDRDRRIMTVVRTSWAQGFGSMTMTTYLTKTAVRQYQLIKTGGYALTLSATRNDVSSTASYNVSLRLVCVGGTIGNGGSEVQIDNVGTLTFTTGQATATMTLSSVTGNDFKFIDQASIKHAVVNVILKQPGNSGSISLGTDTDCSQNLSSYETTNSNTY